MQSVALVDVNGRRTRIRVEGNAAGPPILLLHGIARSLEDWEPQFSRYRRAGYRVIALDLPGFGFSQRLPATTTLPGLAQSVVETLDAIGETRPLHVMGNSMGGSVALQLLTLDPDRVATVVLANSAGFGPEVHLILRMVATPVIGDLVTRSTTRASARILERLLYVDRSFATNERIDHALEIAKQPGTGAVLYETSRSLGTLRGVRSSWRNELMSAVSEHLRPTLIVWGDRDRILPVKQMKTAQRLLPHARVHLFKDAGHMPQLERAAQFGELTLDFLGTQAVA